MAKKLLEIGACHTEDLNFTVQSNEPRQPPITLRGNTDQSPLPRLADHAVGEGSFQLGQVILLGWFLHWSFPLDPSGRRGRLPGQGEEWVTYLSRWGTGKGGSPTYLTWRGGARVGHPWIEWQTSAKAFPRTNYVVGNEHVDELSSAKMFHTV